MFRYDSKQSGVGQNLSPSYDGNAITPADGADLAAGPGGLINTPCTGFYATGAGAVSILLYSGTTAVFTVAAGAMVDVGPIKRINATGTTATGISALYAPWGG